jgi:hypothetical protein
LENKVKSWLDPNFQYEWGLRKHGLAILRVRKFWPRGDRKVTTGITGLWQPSAHSDVAF